MKIQSQASKSKAKYEVGNFLTQYGLPPIAPSKRKIQRKDHSRKFPGKRATSKYYRNQKYGHFKSNDFYKKGKKSQNYHKDSGKQENSTHKTFNKGHCFKCGKKGHFRNVCKSKAKAFINTLVNDQNVKEEILKLLELDLTKSSSSSNDNEFYQLNQSSSEPSRASSSISSGLDALMACKDSCCRNKTISVLSKQEELILDLIEQIEDPVIKAQKLTKFHETLVREASKPKPKIQEPKVDLEKIYNRFTKSKKLLSTIFNMKSRKSSQRLESLNKS